MITPITATFPALNFPKESDYPTQEDWPVFSASAELNYGILSGIWSDKSEEFKAQTNNLALEIQEIGENAINAISLDTIEDLATYNGTGLVMIKDINRGGTFVSKIATEVDPHTGRLYVANNVTVFAKAGGGFWARQYSGAVNVKWAGAKGDGITDDTLAIQNAINNFNIIDFGDKTYKTTSQIYKIDNVKRILKGNATIICDDVSSSNFNANGRYAMMLFNINSLIIDGLKFGSLASNSVVETSANGNLICADTQITAYSQKIEIKNCIFNNSKNDSIGLGVYVGTGNVVEIYIYDNEFYNSGRYDITIQNGMIIEVSDNYSKNAGGFCDVEPNGANDVAKLVNISHNNIDEANYNCIQVSISNASNRGSAVIDGNTMTMNESYIPSIVTIQPLAVRTDYATISDNVMHKGKASRIIEANSVKKLVMTGNTMYASVNNSSAEIVKLINTNAQLVGNDLNINGTSNYITAIGTSKFTLFNANKNMQVGGNFEQYFDILGTNGSLDTRAFLQMGNMQIDTTGLAGSEYVRLKARKLGLTAIEYDANGKIKIPNIPTSSAGLVSGQIWKDTSAGNVIKVV